MPTAIAPAERYSRGAIAFHWTIAVLVIFNLVVGLLHESVPALRALMPAHKAVGITVLALTLGRILWRVTYRPPPLPLGMPGWERAAAHVSHWAFYLLLFALPLTGWAMVSPGVAKRPLSWFGLFDVPPLPVSDATSDVAHTGHVVLGWLFAVLVVIHVAAALRHHFLLRDAVLGRMLPPAAHKA